MKARLIPIVILTTVTACLDRHPAQAQVRPAPAPAPAPPPAVNPTPVPGAPPINPPPASPAVPGAPPAGPNVNTPPAALGTPPYQINGYPFQAYGMNQFYWRRQNGAFLQATNRFYRRGLPNHPDGFYPDGNDIYMLQPNGRYLRYESSGTNGFQPQGAYGAGKLGANGTGTNGFGFYPQPMGVQGNGFPFPEVYMRGADGQYRRYYRARTNEFFPVYNAGGETNSFSGGGIGR